METFYSVAVHEVCGHATGHPTRLNREYGKKFGDQQYAREELVGEPASAFMCAKWGIELEPHPDHAQYLKNWLEVLGSDPKAIFTAASAAQKAVEWCDAKQPPWYDLRIEGQEVAVSASGCIVSPFRPASVAVPLPHGTAPESVV